PPPHPSSSLFPYTTLFRSLFLVLAAGGCKAQSASSGALSPEVVHRIQTEIRSRYSVPPQISISLSELKPGTTPGYDLVIVTFAGDRKSTRLNSSHVAISYA